MEISKSAQQPFIDLVNKILTAKQQNQDTSALEAEIDMLVYQFYNLTSNKIKLMGNYG